MRLSLKLASASAVLALAILPTAARAADPAVVRVAADGRAAGPNGPLGISPNPANDAENPDQIPARSEPTSAPPNTGLFPSFGSKLLDHGIDLHGLLADHYLLNPSAGFVPGRASNLAFAGLAVDLDLNRLVGIPGGTIHFRDNITGLKYGLPAYVLRTGGVLTGQQTTPVPISVGNEISQLTYEQRLYGDRVSIEAGKTNAYRYFFLPNGLDPFSYPSTIPYVDSDFVPFVHNTWGGKVTYKLTPGWYLQSGAFEDNYRKSIYDSYNFGLDGFPGRKYRAGVQVIGEVGYRSEFNTAQYPSNFEAAVIYNTRSRNDLSNEKGTAAPYVPARVATNYPGGAVLYVQGQQVVYRGARTSPDAPPKNIAVYGYFSEAASRPQPFNLDALAGVAFTGFVPGRPADAFSMQAHYQQMSQIEANFETRAERQTRGPVGKQARDGFAFEVNYRAQVTPWASVTPLVQYFVNPDGYYNPFQNHHPKDGFMVGFFTTVSIGPLLGTSRKPS